MSSVTPPGMAVASGPRSDSSERLRIARRVAGYTLLVAALSVASASLLTPGLSARQVPTLTDEDLARPFRASSLSGFKAIRDFEVTDDSRTEARRRAAREQVRPVFDYEPAVESKVKQAVAEGFGLMQAVVAQHAARHSAQPALGQEQEPTVEQPSERRPERRGDRRAERRAERSSEARPEPRPEQAARRTAKDEALLLAELRGARRQFESLVIGTDDEDFEALAADRFSAAVERAVSSLISAAYRSRIVASREELSRVDANGVTVRALGSGTETDGTTSAPAVLDLREVHAELERFATGPGGGVLPDRSPALRRAVVRLAARQVRANLTVNIAETEARRRQAAEAVKPTTLVFKKGQRIIGDGELVNETHLLVVRSLNAQLSELDVLQVQLGGVGLVALLVSATWVFFSALLRRFVPSLRDAVFMALTGLGLLGSLHLWMQIGDALHDRFRWIPIEAFQFAFPVTAGAMLVRLVLSEEHALYFGVVFGVLAGLLLGSSLPYMAFTLLASLAAVRGVARARDRAAVFRAGTVAGTVGAALVILTGLVAGKGGSSETWLGGLFGVVASMVLAPMIVLAVTPVVEALFGYASDLKLLELANLNHPALKELVLQAPGTYHHSIIMGSLVEAAAEAIGANPLLARTCAYYHDLGKGQNPAYFGENQKGENPHDTLPPATSAALIKRHVVDGLELARTHKLPRRVAEAIPQHHGTRTVGFFLHKAKRAAEGREGGIVDEELFRYPGPKPQSQEAALVMIADAVEAASRTMENPSQESLRALVQKLVNLVFSEGQLDECDLTLKDLHRIIESFVRTLEGIYHARPSYPPAATGDPPSPTAGGDPLRALAIVRSLDPLKAAQG